MNNHHPGNWRHTVLENNLNYMNTSFLTTSPELVVNRLCTEQVKVLMAADHPLTEFAQMPWAQLSNYPHVVFKEGYEMQRLVQEWLTTLVISIETVVELNTLDAFQGVYDEVNELFVI